MISEKTIFTFNGMTLEPRKGLDMKNAESLIEHKKNLNKYSSKELSSSPGHGSIGLKNGRGININLFLKLYQI